MLLLMEIITTTNQAHLMQFNTANKEQADGLEAQSP